MPEPEEPRFSLAYTSARPAAIAPALDAWLGSAAAPDGVSAVVCVDEPDDAAARSALAGSRWEARTRLAINRGQRTCVAGWNMAARECSGDVIIAVSDDFVPPLRWDQALAQSAPAGWWREDRVVAVSDGNIRDVFTLAILTRRRYERFGYLYHPAYESLFCDTEFTSVACAERAVIDARRLLFEHRHHDIGKRAKDAVDRLHSSRERWRRGEELFLARQRAGFPREPLGAPAAEEGNSPGIRFALYVQANKDDFCLVECVRALLSQQAPGMAEISAVYLFCPDEYWSGRATEAEESAQVRGAAALLAGEWPGVRFHFETQAIAPMRVASGSRVEVETRARNAALEVIRGGGYRHVIVVDGDEFWRPGMLRSLRDFVRRRRPAAVISHMVPVVGLPGYPVDRARDLATIYVGPHTSFVECRSVCGPAERLAGRGIIHFTATRRSMAEIIQKHRESGHYGDPDYDFEGWIADVLPRVRPGLRGAHMYKPRQIWPLVRRWAPGEWSAIPESLRPYVGNERDLPGLGLLRRLILH